jgi:hypothetical protein
MESVSWLISTEKCEWRTTECAEAVRKVNCTAAIILLIHYDSVRPALPLSIFVSFTAVCHVVIAGCMKRFQGNKTAVDMIALCSIKIFYGRISAWPETEKTVETIGVYVEYNVNRVYEYKRTNKHNFKLIHYLVCCGLLNYILVCRHEKHWVVLHTVWS